MFDAVLTRAACRLLPRGSSSLSAAAAVPVHRPTDSPEITLATSSHTTPCARTKTTELSAAKTSTAESTRRRPIRSESSPKRSNASSVPTAYTAKMTVSIPAEKPHRPW
jgi:hypothetical protein